MDLETSALIPLPTGENFPWWGVLPLDREWLEQKTQDVLGLSHRIARDKVRIGLALCEVKTRLPGRYLHWLATETPLSERTASRYMEIARAFGDYVTQVDQFAPCALYLLSESSVADEVRKQALQLAQDGQKVTRRIALEILDCYRSDRRLSLSPKDQKKYERTRRLIFKEEEVADVDRLKMEEQDVARLVKIGRVLEKLLASFSSVAIERTEVADETTFAVTITTSHPAPMSQTFTDDNLKRVLLESAGEVETKVCLGCKEEKPHRAFGDNKNEPDELMSRCSVCESKRKAARKLTCAAASPVVQGHTPSARHQG